MTYRLLPTDESAARHLAKRHAAERRFRSYGASAVGAALVVLVALLGSILWRGLPAFTSHEVRLEIHFDADLLDPRGSGDLEVLGRGDYGRLVKLALRAKFDQVTGRRERRALSALVSSGAAFELRERVLAEPGLVGTTRLFFLPLSDDADLFFKGGVDVSTREADRRLSDAQISWLRVLEAEGRIESRISRRFFISGDSREPELAGIRGALVGSLWTLLITLLLSFPTGVAAAIYMEEFAPKNRLTDFIEVNINNLAAVPSIVFGLLGLAVLLNFFGMPRSAPLVGGTVLALMTLPTVIITSRSAIRAVPPSVREAALGIGASSLQVVSHHVLPLALPGILTGTIIGMARALGETAPLLMIGMVAFIVDVPSGPTSPATVLPVQIFLWADAPERAFLAKTSAAILVLLAFLVAMNLVAVLLRNRFERRW
ncbi:MAG: phosphate ABC transporter permease PstA [Deltaproteobacteria bacterium]|nr:phosphate ABC transporter permease PstA [Deltaproteobacteria bacterium]